MSNAGDFKWFKKGSLQDQKEDKGKSSTADNKPGQLSTGDRHLALSLGINPKQYHERQSEQTASGSQPRKNRLKGFFNQEGASLIPDSAKQQSIKPSSQAEGSRASGSTETKQPEQLTGDQLIRMEIHPEDYYKTYQVSSHDSIKDIPSGVLRALSEINKGIAETKKQFEAVQSEHLEKSKQEIRETAAVALSRIPEGQPKKALLLGVGNGLDIPLQDLAAKFDSLTLVEVDGGDSTKSAIKQLPLELQPKIRLVIADITGIHGELIKDFNNIKSRTVKEIFDVLPKTIKDIQNKTINATPDLGTDYAFVSSQLVSSQLALMSHAYIQQTMKYQFKLDPFTNPNGSKSDIGKCYQSLNDSLQREHIRYLARSVTPLGTVHFADTYEWQSLSSTSASTGHMVYPENIDPILQENFKPIKDSTRWVFVQDPTYHQFFVTSHSLERNADEIDS